MKRLIKCIQIMEDEIRELNEVINKTNVKVQIASDTKEFLGELLAEVNHNQRNKDN